MAQQVYTVTIPKQSTLFVEGTKAAINAKMKSLGISKYTISKKPLTKEVLSKVKSTSSRIIKPGSITKPVPKSSFQMGGRGPGGPNQSPDNTKPRKSAGIGTQNSTTKKGGGSGVSTKKTNVSTLKADKSKALSQNANQKKVTLNEKVRDLAKKVKNKAPNVSMSKILDTIRTQIRKRPLTAVGVGTGVGFGIATILEVLKPSKMDDATLTGNKIRVINTKGGQKSSKPSGISVTIMTPISKPKREKKLSKDYVTKKNNGNKKQEKMYNLIAGGKGTAKQRLAEIDIEKVLEKKLGRRPDRKELLARLKKK